MSSQRGLVRALFENREGGGYPRAISDGCPRNGLRLALPGMKALALKDEQFVTDAMGRAVGGILDLKRYERLHEAEEDLAYLRAYDAARPKVAADLELGN